MAVIQYTFTHKQYIEQHNRHKQYIEQHNQHKKYIEQHNSLIRKSADRARFCEVHPGICFTAEEKASILAYL